MSNLQMQLAEAEDNRGLRRLAREMPMPGNMRISFRRDPCYFEALAVEGHHCQTLLAKDVDTGAIAGMANRSIKSVFINGEKSTVGYLSGLRVLPEFRGGFPLARGFRYLKTLHRDGRAPFYLASIVSGNAMAAKLASHPRIAMNWMRLGSFKTYAVSTSVGIEARRTGTKLRPATADDMPQLVSFLQREGCRKQFFPVYTLEDLMAPDGTLKGLGLQDILLALDGDEICGVAAAWNQQSFRQSVLEGYAWWLTLLRPLLNGFARLRQLPLLPSPGTALNYFYLSLACIREDNPDLLHDLVHTLLRVKSKSSAFMVAGFHEDDPLNRTLSRTKHLLYPSELYAISPESPTCSLAGLDGRTPYLEVGSL